MNITVYSTSSCATCHLVTDWLDKKDIAYTKKITDEDQAAMEEFMSVNDGMLGVPFTVIEQDSGNPAKILGFDQNEFKKALNIT